VCVRDARACAFQRWIPTLSTILRADPPRHHSYTTSDHTVSATHAHIPPPPHTHTHACTALSLARAHTPRHDSRVTAHLYTVPSWRFTTPQAHDDTSNNTTSLRRHLQQHRKLTTTPPTTRALTGTEIVTNLGLAKEATLREAVIARSEFSKAGLTSSFYEGIERLELPNNNPGTCKFALPCITASAVECQKLCGVRVGDGAAEVFDEIEATEVPVLRRLIAATTKRFSTKGERPSVPAGALLLRFEPKEDGQAEEKFLCPGTTMSGGCGQPLSATE
jgi:hypothetical protein